MPKAQQARTPRVAVKNGRIVLSVDIPAMLALPPAARARAFAVAGRGLEHFTWMLKHGTDTKGRPRAWCLAELGDEHALAEIFETWAPRSVTLSRGR